MRRLVSTSRPLLSSMASAPSSSCWWRLQLIAASDPRIHRVPRFPHGSRNLASSSGERDEEESGIPNYGSLIPTTEEVMILLAKYSDMMKNVEDSETTKDFIACEDGRRRIMEAVYRDTNRREIKGRSARSSVGRVVPLNILPDSSHRDSSIYRDTSKWTKEFCIADRRETRLEAMMLSNPTDCDIYDEDGNCIHHGSRRMLQIFSLKVAKIPVDVGKIELYGYIAARDDLEPLLNYVVNVSRDDPIIVEKGSLINIAPKRGIKLGYDTLIEYDMKIKTGEHEKDDLQLIDGVSVIGIMGTPNWSVFTSRIIGDCGAIDISASRLNHAVEATVEVLVSEVQGSFSMRLGCFTSGLDKEIQLFDGTIGEPRRLTRYVVAVMIRTEMDMKFKVGAGSSRSSEHCCSFTAHNHGHDDRLIKTDFALISVKVTWSVLPGSWPSDLKRC